MKAMDYINTTARNGLHSQIFNDMQDLYGDSAYYKGLRYTFGKRNVHVSSDSVHEAESKAFGDFGYWSRWVDLYEMRQAHGMQFIWFGIKVGRLTAMYRLFGVRRNGGSRRR